MWTTVSSGEAGCTRTMDPLSVNKTAKTAGSRTVDPYLPQIAAKPQQNQ
ncbi:hypothetical protein [Paenibacillus sp. GCM10027626]